MSQRIAFFDFDGTITTKDTLLEFIKYSKGTLPFFLGFLLNAPWLVAYRLKLISNQQAKERILTWFFRNADLGEFGQTCDRFAAEKIPGLLRPKALHEIERLQQQGFTVVIVSASPENWLRNWTKQVQTRLLATRLEIRTAGKDGPELAPLSGNAAPGRQLLTGRILGVNCHGKEKVRRIQELYALSDYAEIYAYGDTSGDKPMLALANHAFYKPFR